MADVGLIGLAVMGENLVLNMESRGFKVAVYNRTVARVEEFVGGRGAGKNITGCSTLEEFVGAIARPRRIVVLVRAGPAVDATLGGLRGLLEAGDCVVDAGNSNWADTVRRAAEMGGSGGGVLFCGAGVSGGEEGALTGPSIMPGGDAAAWPLLRPLFHAIAAQVDGQPCCHWVGADGAGHFVKMVHNGIEYGDMQLIAEAYHLMRTLGRSNEQMAETFEAWNRGPLDSYLIEITAAILRKRDDAGGYVLDSILDAAGQKGTGKWTAEAALDLGMPLTLIGEAVFARCLSALKHQRRAAAAVLPAVDASFPDDMPRLLDALRDALYCSKIISYAQGFTLMAEAADDKGWQLNFGEIALMWRGGCIIRSVFLGKIKEAFDSDPSLKNLILAPFFKDKIGEGQAGWRYVISTAVQLGVPVPAFSSALAYYDGYRTENLPANMIQAQRDYFGAHTYKRLGGGDEVFHTNWTGRGGTTASTTYNA